MKYLKVILSLGLAGTAAWLAGCSKPKDAATRAGAISTESSSEPVTMKIKWVTGKQYGQKMIMDMNVHMNIPNMPKPMDQEMNLTQSFSVAVKKDLPDGGHELETTFTGEKMENKMSGKVMGSFDSDNDAKQDAGNPMAPMFRKMVGAHVGYQTDAKGEVIKVLNFDEFISTVSGGNPQTEAMMRGIMNEDMVKQMAMPGSGLPEKPVKIGDHWPVHRDVAAGPMGTMTLNMKYTFKGWQENGGHKCAVLGFVGDISSKPGGSANGMNVSIDKGTMLGDTWFDPELGMVVDTVSEQNMDMKIAMQGKNMTSVMKQKIEVKLGEVTDLPK